MLFVPDGFLLPASFDAALVFIATPLAIECAQKLFTSRYAQLDDLIMNAAGAAIGYCVWRGLSAPCAEIGIRKRQLRAQ